MNYKVPYLLEVWEENYSNGQWNEQKVVCIGAHDMEFEGRAHDINFSKQISGEINLSFSLDGKYVDNESGDYIDNYLIPYLYNECKIKLKYDGEWFDFIVKNINETHNTKLTMEYECQYLPIYELSKTGYDISFSIDDETGSAVQDAASFMNKILEDSEWNYVSAGSAPVQNKSIDLSEYSRENCYSYEVTSSINIYPFTINGSTITLGSVQSKTNGYIFIPNSEEKVTISNTSYSFVYWNSGQSIDLIDNNLISRKDLVLIPTSSLGSARNITKYYMEVPKASLYSEYISYIDYDDNANSITQYCNKFTEGEESETDRYYRTITKSTEFGYIQTSDTVPTYRGLITQSKLTTGVSTYYIKKPNDTEGYYYSWTTSETTTFREGDTIDIYTNNDDIWGYLNGDSINKFNLSLNAYQTEPTPILAVISNKIYYKKRYTYNGNVTFIPQYQINGFELGETYYSCDVNAEDITQLANITLSTKEYFSVDRTNSKITGINILGYGPVDQNYYYAKDNNGSYYFNEKTNEYTTTSISGARRYRRVLIQNIYSYNMYRTLEASKSNCFNLTQQVAEIFEVWCRYIIEYNSDGSIAVDTNGRRKKWITLVSDYGKENQVGFTYGLNTSSIQRTIQSNDIATKLIVENCENSSSSDGIISIGYASNNLSRETTIYNFDYFIQKGLLDGQAVARDLYEIEVYRQEDPFDILEDNNYIEGNEDGPGYLRHLGMLNKEYDNIYVTVLGTGETGLYNQLTSYKTLYNTYKIACAIEGNALTPQDQTYDTLEKRRAHDLEIRDSYYALVQETQGKINKYEKYLQDIVDRKKSLTQVFNKKYARFIQEGSWQADNYVSHEAYYNDALKVSSDSAKPSIEYSIDIIDLYALPEYREFKFDVGDITWIEDTDYFGYTSTGKPYQEKVVVKQIDYDLDNPSQTKITIANYSNKFEDLFQRLSSTIQSYQLNQNVYNRAQAITTSGALEYISLQDSFNKNKALTIIDNDSVNVDNYGITLTNPNSPQNIVRLTSGGIVLSSDGGQTYQTGVYAGEINTALIKAGSINTEQLSISTTQENGNIQLTGSKLSITNNITASGQQGTSSIEISNDGLYLKKNNETLFSFDADGNLYVAGAANIGNWTVDTQGLIYKAASGDSQGIAYIYPNGGTAEWNPTGSSNKNDWRLLFGSKSTSGGTTYTYKFGVDDDGNLYATSANLNNATISGSITSTSGTIGGWTLGNNSLYTGTNSTSTAPIYYLGNSNILKTDGCVVGGSENKQDWRLLIGDDESTHKFGVDSSGNLFAESANLKTTTLTGNLTLINGDDGTLTTTIDAYRMKQLIDTANETATTANAAAAVASTAATSANEAAKTAEETANLVNSYFTSTTASQLYLNKLALYGLQDLPPYISMPYGESGLRIAPDGVSMNDGSSWTKWSTICSTTKTAVFG